MWLNGEPPKDEPLCGFDGSCERDWKSFVIAFVVSLIFIKVALLLMR